MSTREMEKCEMRGVKSALLFWKGSEAKPRGTPSVTAMPCHLPRGWRLCVPEPASETSEAD